MDRNYARRLPGPSYERDDTTVNGWQPFLTSSGAQQLHPTWTSPGMGSGAGLALRAGRRSQAADELWADQMAGAGQADGLTECPVGCHHGPIMARRRLWTCRRSPHRLSGALTKRT
jgi:hypothetical protein